MKNSWSEIIKDCDNTELTELELAIARETLRRDFQARFDAFVEELNDNNFYLDMPDFPSLNFIVMDANEDND